LVGTLAASEPPPTKYDVLIRGARVVDGTGSPWYQADIAIHGDRVRKIGRIDGSSAVTVIQADGLYVAPGFVDMMGQSATGMMDDPKSAMNLLTQGITTINAGEGVSAAPLAPDDGKKQGWTTMAEYFALLDMKGLPLNVVQTVGHTQVRRIVLGETDRRPNDQELVQMQELVREGMQAGAIGVSTALIYPPAVYAQTPEIAALAKIAGQYGGGYYTHMRNESDQLLEAIEEALDIGTLANSRVHIFHLKTAGQQNWGKMRMALARIQAARDQGQQVTADVYPYIHNGLEIAAFIHPRHFAQGRTALRRQLDDPELRKTIRSEMDSTDGWENWFRNVDRDWERVVIGQTQASGYQSLAGKSVAEIARAKQEDPWSVFFALVQAGATAMPQSMTEANKILAMQQNFVSFCTDTGPVKSASEASHPRGYGAFARLLARYVREQGVLSLERAVAQASATAANTVLAFDRGRIAEGMAADLIVFDFKEVRDRATFAEPSALSTGIKHVMVNGQLVLRDGQQTSNRPGRVLRGPGYRSERSPPSVSTGASLDAFRSFDQSIQEFMDMHRVPGAAVAITDGSKIVYARGFGYADLSDQTPVHPASLFRIASISKCITAVAILQLVERGKLSLSDKIIPILDCSADIEAAGSEFDPRWRDVTVQHLLEHRGGWDRDKSFDAMFQSTRFAHLLGVPAPANSEDVVRAMLRQRFDFDPGERYAYSNFGYCLLGRAIQKITGQSYEEYVKTNVLRPIGVTTMRIGASRLEGRAADEVRYYQPGQAKSVFQYDLGQPTPWPYGGWHLEAMDAHGGWIASAVDLARFAMALDDPDRSPLLSRQSIQQMHARPDGLAGHDKDGKEKEVYYSLGWNNRVVGPGRVNHWHTGSLNGTATILVRRNDGRNFVMLMNSRVSPTAEHLGLEADRMLTQASQRVQNWPSESADKK
jgi:N-acyl-D-amino-acid deacylase